MSNQAPSPQGVDVQAGQPRGVVLRFPAGPGPGRASRRPGDGGQWETAFLRRRSFGPGRYQPAGIRRLEGAECGKTERDAWHVADRYSAYSLQTAQKPLLLTPPTPPPEVLCFSLPPPPNCDSDPHIP
ncbi:hypothetical protein R6Z07F_017064 [Ovis aries]